MDRSEQEIAQQFPPPVVIDGRTIVAADVTNVEARVTFDVAHHEATVTASVDLWMVDGRGAGVGGYPALDLRHPVDEVLLDSQRIGADGFGACDLGGGPGAAMRVVDAELAPGSRHRLDLRYRLGRPDTEGALPVGWTDSGVRFDLWMSDLYPGRYLEQWFPSPLCGDRFALSLDVEVTGTDRPHLLAANTDDGGDASTGRAWTLRYPAHFTSLSPMLVLAPADEVEVRRSTVALTGRAEPIRLLCARHTDVDADLAAGEADVASWLAYAAARYGPWAHGDRFTAFVWGPGRGMEYDGATTAAVGALEHEVFHSWFGRGVKPATSSDGWIDEAYTSWATASRRVEQPRFLDEPLSLDEAPVLLYPPHPWSRYTPIPSYREGARLFAGLAAAMGGPDRLRSAMAAWYSGAVGGLVTTDSLQQALTVASGVDVRPWFERFVHGRG